jgi:hypothetical protein
MASGLLSKLTMATAGAAVLGMGVASAPADAASLTPFKIKTGFGGLALFDWDEATKNITNFSYKPGDELDGASVTKSATGLTGTGGYGASGFLAGAKLERLFSLSVGPKDFGFLITGPSKQRPDGGFNTQVWGGVLSLSGVVGEWGGVIAVGTDRGDGAAAGFQGETVPEPTTIVGSLLGLGALAGARLKRKTAQ